MPSTPNQPAVPAGEDYLVLDGVSRSYGNAEAVKDVGIRMRRGEFLTLLGPSGSGKSTTLMMIAGFVQPDAGSIRLNGRDITTLPPHKRDFGIVFQNYALFPHMTIKENLEFGLRMRRIDASTRTRRVSEVLELVGLQDLRHRFPHQISGGQQQRVAVGRALIYEPSVLLMDEPLGALDRNMRQQMQYEIMEIHQKLGATIVYVTHDQEEALHMSDRIAIMDKGKVQQISDPVSLYQKPDSQFVAGFLGDSNFISGQIGMEAGETFLTSVEGDRFALADRGGKVGNGKAATLSIRPERVTISRQSASRQSASRQSNGANFSIPATVRKATYGGDNWRYLVACEHGTEIMIKSQNTSETLFSVNHGVTIGWDIVDAKIFQA